MSGIITMEADLEKCIAFLNGIGIQILFKKLDAGCFLPGLTIENGILLVDRPALKYPGDILHEAGHIAVVQAADRPGLNTISLEQRKDREAEEMMAIAWSYAACVHLNIDPHFVFHDHGYQNGGRQIAENFSNKRYIGLPMLQWIGLTADKKNAAVLQVPPFPHMIKWMRE